MYVSCTRPFRESIFMTTFWIPSRSSAFKGFVIQIMWISWWPELCVLILTKSAFIWRSASLNVVILAIIPSNDNCQTRRKSFSSHLSYRIEITRLFNVQDTYVYMEICFSNNLIWSVVISYSTTSWNYELEWHSLTFWRITLVDVANVL